MKRREQQDTDRSSIAPEPARPTILVVDDEALVRTMVAEELRDHDYAVVEAADADEALSILQDDIPVDLLLTDVRMPGRIDGAGLARVARAEYPALKIVVVSGHMSASEIEGTADGFFVKPFDFGKLIDRVRTLLPENPRAAG